MFYFISGLVLFIVLMDFLRKQPLIRKYMPTTHGQKIVSISLMIIIAITSAVLIFELTEIEPPLVIFYFLSSLFLFIALLDFLRKQPLIKEYVLAGQRQNIFFVSLSLLASIVGGSALLGQTDLRVALIWYASCAFGLICLGFFLAKKVRVAGVATLAEMATLFFPSTSRQVIAIIVFIVWTGITAAQFVACGTIVERLTPFSAENAIVISAILITSYTLLGGQNSIIRTDAIQFIIILTTLLAICIYLYTSADTKGATYSLDLFTNFPTTIDITPINILYFVVILGGSYFVCPLLFSRLFAAKDEVIARNSVFISAGGYMVIGLLIFLIGVWAVNFGDATQASLLHKIVPVLPPWLYTLFFVALFCAIISSADSCLMTAASTVELDLVQGKSVLRIRFFIFLSGFLSLMIALLSKDIIGLLLAANNIFSASVVYPVAVGLFAYGRKAINKQILFTAMCVGAIFGLCASIISFIPSIPEAYPLFTEENISLFATGLALIISLLALYVPAKKITE